MSFISLTGRFGGRWSLRALSGGMGSDWERERRDTLFLMATIGLAVLPHIGYLPIWIPFAFGIMFCWRLTLIFSGRELPGTWLRTIGAVACLAAVFAQYQSLLGREQGVAMLTLFLGLKLLEMKARRDLFVATFLCFFLLLTSFFHSQSMLSSAMVVLAVIALIATMITMQFGHQEFPITQRFRHAAIIVLQALPIAIALFVLFPRLATPLWGMQGQGSGANTGLSDSMSPGEVSSLAKSAAVALRARFANVDAAPPRPLRYWRGPVFGQFDGRTWRALPASDPAPPDHVIHVERPDDAVPYVVTLEASDLPWLPALDMPAAFRVLTGNGTASITRGFVLRLDRPVFQRIQYSVDSHLNYRIGQNETEQSLQPWLQLPEGFNPQTLALARQWQREAGPQATAAIVERTLAMFREQAFFYTLEPPALGRDSVDDFLFGSRAGFCEHYASSFVVLLRAAGIPARVVTGYQGGESNPVDDFMVVRQSDAHAWAEYWDPRDGWVRADPTGAVAPERVQTNQRLQQDDALTDPLTSSSLWQALNHNLDALSNRWNQWVLNYDRQSQGRLLEKLGLDAGDWGSLASMLAATLTLLIGGSALLTLQPRAAVDPLARTWQAFCAKLAGAGISRLAHETPAQYLARAADSLNPASLDQAQRVVDLYTQLRYGALSDVYQGRERRKRDRGTAAGIRRTALARERMRELRLIVDQFRVSDA